MRFPGGIYLSHTTPFEPVSMKIGWAVRTVDVEKKKKINKSIPKTERLLVDEFQHVEILPSYQSFHVDQTRFFSLRDRNRHIPV
jgi:hypothetical protein